MELADRISHLTSVLSEQNQLICQKLRNQNKAADDDDFPAELQEARDIASEASKELTQLLIGPQQSILSMTQERPATLGLVSSFRLANAVPLEGDASFGQIAQEVGLEEDLVQRIMRHAMTDNIFQEPRKGFVAHTRISKFWARDTGVQSYVDFYFNEISAAMLQVPKSIRNNPKSQSGDHNGIVESTGQKLFQYFQSNPERGKVFSQAMRMFSQGAGFEAKWIIEGFSWGDLGDATVVDVGGGKGDLMEAIVRGFPKLKVVVQDLPGVVAQFPVPSPELDDRFKYLGHNFFTEQPIVGADIYFFRHILHNWSDEDCVKILRATVPALRIGSRLMICDDCLPEPNTIQRSQERSMRSMDIMMLTLLNAKERDENQWKALFFQADPKFFIESISKPDGSSLSIIVVGYNHSKE